MSSPGQEYIRATDLQCDCCGTRLMVLEDYYEIEEQIICEACIDDFVKERRHVNYDE